MPVIDMKATGMKIKELIKKNGLTIVAVQEMLGFGTPQAIYKWFKGTSLPTLDNLVILAHILNSEIGEIVITK